VNFVSGLLIVLSINIHYRTPPIQPIRHSSLIRPDSLPGATQMLYALAQWQRTNASPLIFQHDLTTSVTPTHSLYDSADDSLESVVVDSASSYHIHTPTAIARLQ
jgi:hypothetical protein